MMIRYWLCIKIKMIIFNQWNICMHGYISFIYVPICMFLGIWGNWKVESVHLTFPRGLLGIKRFTVPCPDVIKSPINMQIVFGIPALIRCKLRLASLCSPLRESTVKRLRCKIVVRRKVLRIVWSSYIVCISWEAD